MAYVILHNRRTEETFRYDVPQREAQALVDMAWGGTCRLDWAVKEASVDVAVPRVLDMNAEG